MAQESELLHASSKMLRARSNVSFTLLLKYNIFEITFFQARGALETALYTTLSTLSDIWEVEMHDRSISCILSFHYSRTHSPKTRAIPGTSINQIYLTVSHYVKIIQRELACGSYTMQSCKSFFIMLRAFASKSWQTLSMNSLSIFFVYSDRNNWLFVMKPETSCAITKLLQNSIRKWTGWSI